MGEIGGYLKNYGERRILYNVLFVSQGKCDIFAVIL